MEIQFFRFFNLRNSFRFKSQLQMKRYQNLFITAFVIFNLTLLVIVLLSFAKNRVNNKYISNDAAVSLIKASEYQYNCEKKVISITEYADSLFRLANTGVPLLVLRISETHCEVCTVQALTDFLELAKSISSYKLLIISSYGDERQLGSMKNRVYPIPVINVKTTNSLMEETNTPYLFLLYPTLETSMYILYQKEFPEKSAAYFNAVKKILVNE